MKVIDNYIINNKTFSKNLNNHRLVNQQRPQYYAKDMISDESMKRSFDLNSI